jgi:hypothetical protein
MLLAFNTQQQFYTASPSEGDLGGERRVTSKADELGATGSVSGIPKRISISKL